MVVSNGMKNGNANGGYRRASFGLATPGRPFVVGHRGASAVFPENTILSITQAIADGAEAIEFDIQTTADNEIVIMHDRTLDRTTTGNGAIAHKNYYGDIEYVTTKASPGCPIARFQDVVDVLIEEKHSHVWAVVDVKMNVPITAFKDIADILRERNPDLSVFSNRIILGLWHPKFLSAAQKYLPDLPVVHIGASISIAREHFPGVDAYSMRYETLAGPDGKQFIEEAHLAGKPVMAWTVNYEFSVADCQRWGVDAIITDRTKKFVQYFANKQTANAFLSRPGWWAWLRGFLYAGMQWLAHSLISRELREYGPLEAVYE